MSKNGKCFFAWKASGQTVDRLSLKAIYRERKLFLFILFCTLN
jgi:hypothetical protein